MNNKELYKQIAEWITETGLEHTSNGSYYAYFEEIAEQFQVSEAWVKAHVSDIEEYFDTEIIAEWETDDESFGMMFYLQYCCEHCSTYLNGSRCYDECSSCECWVDDMDGENEDKE